MKRPFKQAASFAKLLKEGRYDIVHDNLSVSTILLMREAKKQGVPVRILHSHNSKLGETPQKEKRNALLLPLLLSKVNAFAACSDMAAKAMFGDAKYELIPNIIDADKYSFDPEIRKTVREQMGADGKFIVATVGRLAAQKNPFFALFPASELRHDDTVHPYATSGHEVLGLPSRGHAGTGEELLQAHGHHAAAVAVLGAIFIWNGNWHSVPLSIYWMMYQ